MEFTDYNKITDILMYLDDKGKFRLSLVVKLNSKDKNNNERNFHSEYHYPNEYKGINRYSITRNFSEYFLLGDPKDFKKSVIIRPSDLMMMRLVLNNVVRPWFIGNGYLYTLKDDKLILTGTFNDAEIAFDDYSVIHIHPIVYTFRDGKMSEGIRLYINSKTDFCDMPITKFWEFYYYMTQVDIYTAASIMVNYVKTQPYGQNMLENGQSDFYNGSKKRNGYFDNL